MRRQQFLLFRIYRFQDAAAYGELYDAFYERIHRYITFKIPHFEDVDELTSEVFLRGWEYATASKVENFNALVYRIARNLIADYYRSKKVTGPIEEAEAQIQPGRSLEETVMIKEEFRHIMQKLNKLKDEYRDVLVMRFLDELSIAEIAEALEKTPNTVRVTLHRAKKALQEII